MIIEQIVPSVVNLSLFLGSLNTDLALNSGLNLFACSFKILWLPCGGTPINSSSVYMMVIKKS